MGVLLQEFPSRILGFFFKKNYNVYTHAQGHARLRRGQS